MKMASRLGFQPTKVPAAHIAPPQCGEQMAVSSVRFRTLFGGPR